MALTKEDLNILYHQIIDQSLKDTNRLPSLPDVAFEVRDAVADENTTVETLAALIAKEPALIAYLIKSAASPIYRRPVPPKTLAEVISLLGFGAVNSLVLMYCARSMLVLEDPTAKKLFNHTWERLVVKTSVASFLAQQLKYQTLERVQMAMLLSEVGSLAVLSALVDGNQLPDTEMYFELCRGYSKTLGCIMLDKWNVDPMIIELLWQYGEWQETWDDKINMLDIANLSLYYTILYTKDNMELPPLEDLAVYQKLPESMQKCSKPNWLEFIIDNEEQINIIISSLK